MYEVTKGQQFRHYKGNVYTIVCLATHTEECEAMVIYHDEHNCFWARPAEMFFGYLQDGTKRFTPIEE